MNVDQSGIDFIKQFEGFRAEPYRDQKGRFTIGYGHTNGVTAYSHPITQSQAEELLRADLKSAEKTVTQLVTVQLTQVEFNALVSFVFNVGHGHFLTSTLLKKLNSGDKFGASKEILRFVYYRNKETGLMQVSEGLSDRRAKESELFSLDLHEKKAVA